jgi:hypothetical protein
VGPLDESELISDIVGARKVLASTIEDGLFFVEEQREFEFKYYFSSIEEWTSFLETEGWGDNAADEKLVEAVRSLLTPGRDEIFMREPVRASRLVRME